MQITIIGSGNVATVLGKKFLASDVAIRQVYSPNISHANALASQLSARAIDSLKNLDFSADVFIIAVSDDALHASINWPSFNDRIVAHTAGSVSMHILKPLSSNYGVFYPFQSLRKELPTVPTIPIILDGNNDHTLGILSGLARRISDDITVGGDETRKKLHLSAVLTNNFINHLLVLAEQYCQRENIEFKLLRPLLDETVRRLELASPAQLQTGPAQRKDLTTIKKQRDMLNAHPRLLEVYDFFTKSISSGDSPERF